MDKREELVAFKASGGVYIGGDNNITPENVYKAFYKSIAELKEIGVRYSSIPMYTVSRGDYKNGIVYTYGEEKYYMFYGANSCYAPPQTLAIGASVDGLIYLIWEDVPDGGYEIRFRIVPEEFVDCFEHGFRPKSYDNIISVFGRYNEDDIEKVTEKDLQCLEMGLKGITAFDELINQVLKSNTKQGKMLEKKND